MALVAFQLPQEPLNKKENCVNLIKKIMIFFQIFEIFKLLTRY